MSNMRLRILDLDGSLLAQPAFSERLTAAQVINLRDLENELRLWATADGLAQFRRRLDGAPPLDGSGPEITFMGSGDFHHLAAVLIARQSKPVTLLHFDNHPDWVCRPPAWHCGSWINRVLDLPNVERVVTLGPCSADLSWPQLRGGNLAALDSGRLRILPWRHPPSRRIGAPPLVWRNLADEKDWVASFEDMVGELPTESVWISIDKDVLRAEDAATNWDQGDMPLSNLVSALKGVAGRRSVLGIDVCGEYSPARFSSPLKRLSAWLDHPRKTPTDGQPINSNTNQILLSAFEEMTS